MDEIALRVASARKSCPFLTTAQAAFYVGLSRRTLEKMRSLGVGPKYRKHGRYVRYHIDDLDAWSEQNGRVPNRLAEDRAGEPRATVTPLRRPVPVAQ